MGPCHTQLGGQCIILDSCASFCKSPAPHIISAAQGTPPAYKKKASRLVGGKCTLLARIDAYGQDPTGAAGANMKVWHMQVLVSCTDVFRKTCAAVKYGVSLPADRSITKCASLGQIQETCCWVCVCEP